MSYNNNNNNNSSDGGSSEPTSNHTTPSSSPFLNANTTSNNNNNNNNHFEGLNDNNDNNGYDQDQDFNNNNNNYEQQSLIPKQGTGINENGYYNHDGNNYPQYTDINEYMNNNNNNNNNDPRSKLLYQIYSIVLAIIYLSVSIIIPLMNKQVFQNYNYPLTATVLQTIGATILLLIFNVIQYYHHRDDLVPKSYITDRNFISKCLTLLPVSIIFALVMAFTNIGISMVPINYHVIFKSTNIIWVVLFSFIVHKEKPTILIASSIILLMAGTILVSLVFSGSEKSTFWPICINLLSSFFEAIMLIVLKWTCQYLLKYDSTITVIEITFFKCFQGSLILLIPMFILEHVNGFTILNQVGLKPLLFVVGGIFITMIYQATTVAIIKSLYVITVGILIQVQIIPQIFLAIVLFHSFIFSNLHIVGVTLSILGCVVFAVSNWYHVFRAKM